MGPDDTLVSGALDALAAAGIGDHFSCAKVPKDAVYRGLVSAAAGLFGALKNGEPVPGAFGPMENLFCDEGFDHEQVWAQINAMNICVLKHFTACKREQGRRLTIIKRSPALTGAKSGSRSCQIECNQKKTQNVGENIDIIECNPRECDSVLSIENDDCSVGSLSGTTSDDDDDNDSGDDDDDNNDLGDDDDSGNNSVSNDNNDNEDQEDIWNFNEDKKVHDSDEESNADSDDLLASNAGNDLMDDEAAKMTYADFFGPEPPRDFGGNQSNLANEDHGVSSGDQEEQDQDEDEDESLPLSQKITNLFADDGASVGGDAEDDLDHALHESGFHADRLAATHGEVRSTFERQADALAQQIHELENEAVREKNWTMKGEVGSKKRPVNSMLDEIVDFENVSKPVPIITEEFSKSLDEIIRGRVARREFDDVVAPAKIHERKYVPLEEVSDEKSRKSLAQVYEDAYVKSVTESKSSPVVEALKKQHDEINTMEADLFRKLDALTNFFYTPKPAAPEENVASAKNVPAVMVEEVIPTVVSDAARKAPHEIFKRERVLKTRAEMKSTEATRLRRAAKAKIGKQVAERKKVQDIVGKSKKAVNHDIIASLVKSTNVTIVDRKTVSLKHLSGAKPKKSAPY